MTSLIESAAILGLLVLAAFMLKWQYFDPARASDDVELGWDDVLRHRRVRELTIDAAWLPAGIVVVADWSGTSDSLNLLPLYAVAGVAILLSLTFRQGRHLWRQRWDGLGPA